MEALEPRVKGRRPLVIIDEVQKVPALLDVVQDVVDRERANVVLTGSSARKLRRGGVRLVARHARRPRRRRSGAGFGIVCHVPRKVRLTSRIIALPWQAVDELMPS